MLLKKREEELDEEGEDIKKRRGLRRRDKKRRDKKRFEIREIRKIRDKREIIRRDIKER